MKKAAVHNPNDMPEAELPVIYGFNNGCVWGDNWHGVLLAQDGTPLGSHVCSNEWFMWGDLGILEGTRSDRHETFREHYPDGYRMEFVGYNDVAVHAGLQAAFKLLDERKPEPKGDEASISLTITS